MRKIVINNLVLYQFEQLARLVSPPLARLVSGGDSSERANQAHLINYFSTRIGGVSTGKYAALNLGLSRMSLSKEHHIPIPCVGMKHHREIPHSGHTQDDPSCVLENRKRFCAAAGIKIENLVMGKQVHHSMVRIVTKAETGCGAQQWDTALEATDAMLTQEKGIALMAFSADCPLIMCYDPIKEIIGVIHASWRSMVEGIIPKTMVKMQEQFNTNPADVIAAISPSIGPCCYEVKNDFIKTMTGQVPSAQEFVLAKNNKIYFDLWRMVRSQLITAGLRSENIESADLCTCCYPEEFYSYRRDGADTGRLACLISQQ